jgi:hypothetical protein
VPVRAPQGSDLPFTGFDLSMVILLGLVLVAAGSLVRLCARRVRRV